MTKQPRLSREQRRLVWPARPWRTRSRDFGCGSAARHRAWAATLVRRADRVAGAAGLRLVFPLRAARRAALVSIAHRRFAAWLDARRYTVLARLSLAFAHSSLLVQAPSSAVTAAAPRPRTLARSAALFGPTRLANAMAPSPHGAGMRSPVAAMLVRVRLARVALRARALSAARREPVARRAAPSGPAAALVVTRLFERARRITSDATPRPRLDVATKTKHASSSPRPAPDIETLFTAWQATREARPVAPQVAPAATLDVERLAEQVIDRIDRRVVAQRERLGRI